MSQRIAHRTVPCDIPGNDTRQASLPADIDCLVAFSTGIVANQNNMVVIKGKVTRVGTASMEVCEDTYAENLQGARQLINNAHFMMVALDENGKPEKVSRLTLRTAEKHLAWEHEEERRRIRNQREMDKLDGI